MHLYSKSFNIVHAFIDNLEITSQEEEHYLPGGKSAIRKNICVTYKYKIADKCYSGHKLSVSNHLPFFDNFNNQIFHNLKSHFNANKPLPIYISKTNCKHAVINRSVPIYSMSILFGCAALFYVLANFYEATTLHNYLYIVMLAPVVFFERYRYYSSLSREIKC